MEENYVLVKNIKDYIINSNVIGSLALKEQAEILASFALGQNPYPREFFQFITDFLSDPIFFKRPGAGDFVFEILLDIFRFTEDQKREFINVVTRNFKEYTDRKLCLMVCDAVGSNYSRDESLNFFQISYTNANSSGQEGIELALDVIASLSLLDENILSRISNILKSRDPMPDFGTDNDVSMR